MNLKGRRSNKMISSDHPQNDLPELPPELLKIRDLAFHALGDLKPAGSPRTKHEPMALMLSTRADDRYSLPPYYLVYFLLIDLLEFQHLGKSEKTAWTVPVRLQGRLYGIEHRKMGFGVYSPNLDPNANKSVPPNEQQKADVKEICDLIAKAVVIAEPYFEWRAEQAAKGSDLNALNRSAILYLRYEYFRDRFKSLAAEAIASKGNRNIPNEVLDNSLGLTTGYFPGYTPEFDAEWNGQAAIEAFFSWTEHVFIHLAVLQGKLKTGDEVARLAASDWKSKFKAALALADNDTKKHYDTLIGLRSQIRNFMAHGSFGKRGEALEFHSGAGAAPILLTDNKMSKYSLTGNPDFDESAALEQIEAFINHLWSGPLKPAKEYIFSIHPSILSFAADDTYSKAMESIDAMKKLVDRLYIAFEKAQNMEW